MRRIKIFAGQITLAFVLSSFVFFPKANAILPHPHTVNQGLALILSTSFMFSGGVASPAEN